MDDDGMVRRQILRGRFERFRLTQEPIPLLLSKSDDARITAALDRAMRAGELEPASVIAWPAGRLPEAILRDFLGWSDAAIAKSASRAARLGQRPAAADDAIRKAAAADEDPEARQIAKALRDATAALRAVLPDDDDD